MAQEKNCPNYSDIVSFLAEPKEKTELNRNIDRIGDCTECAEAGVCDLWVTCLFIDDFAPRLGVPPKDTPVPTSNATFRPLKKFKIAYGNKVQTY